MSALYGVICPYCHKKAYVQVPDTPPSSPQNGDVEAVEETPCPVCGEQIEAYTKSNAEWGVRKK